MQMSKEYIKRCSIALAIRNMQTKTTTTPLNTKMTTDNNKYGQERGEVEAS